MSPLLIVAGLFGIILIFGAVAAIALTGGDKEVESRLEEYVGGTVIDIPEDDVVSAEGPDVADRLDSALSGRDFFESTRQRIAKADMKLRVSEYFGLVVIAGVVGGIAGYFFGRANPVLAIIGFLVGLKAFPVFKLAWRHQNGCVPLMISWRTH